MIAFFIKFCFLITILVALTIHYLVRKQPLPSFTPKPTHLPIPKKWVIRVILLCISLYILFAFIISTSWFKADEWAFISDYTIKDRVHIIINRWLQSNGRMGDIVGSIIGLSLNRWQHILLTPFLVVSAPLAVFLLVKPKEEQHFFSSNAFFFILFYITIIAISVNTTPWRNYYDFAAAINYIWPCTIICFFLSFFRADLWNTNSDSKLRTVFLALLGIYCGWSLECITLFLLPFSLLWLVVRYRKKLYVPRSCFAGICGFIIGAFMLISSPGLAARGTHELVRSTLDISSLSFNEALAFALNHSPENMAQITGVTVDFYLKDLPLILRPLYLPELMERFISCCYPLLICTALLLITVWFTAPALRRKAMYTSFAIILLSFLCAGSYIYGCIPRKMSYYPAIFILAIACSYLFIHFFHLNRKKFIALTLASCIAFCVTIIPPVVEALEYKHYENGLREVMFQKMKNGEDDFYRHPKTFTTQPKNKLGLISDAKHVW